MEADTTWVTAVFFLAYLFKILWLLSVKTVFYFILFYSILLYLFIFPVPFSTWSILNILLYFILTFKLFQIEQTWLGDRKGKDVDKSKKKKKNLLEEKKKKTSKKRRQPLVKKSKSNITLTREVTRPVFLPVSLFSTWCHGQPSVAIKRLENLKQLNSWNLWASHFLSQEGSQRNL